MPRPRFSKLEADKQRRILRAAREAFSAYGFEGASLNQIIEHAGISKGAVYYYFDDKADLLATVLLDLWQQLLPMADLDPSQLTAETYWSHIQKAWYQATEGAAQDDSIVGIGKLFYRLSPDVLAGTVFERELQQGLELLDELVQRGQLLGTVRDDLPRDLLLAVIGAAAEASDRWMAENWEQLEPSEAMELSDRLFDILKRLAEPPERHVSTTATTTRR